ncbi:MAG TPA: DoxX family protein [Acidimicrobiia bacterium]|nr:DoxX family protein [Acidimicrobiia bacterium]
MMAGMFIYGGYDALRNPQSKVPAAEPVVAEIEEVLAVDASTERLIKLNAAVQIGAGVALAIGVLPRVAALALAGSLVPTTLAGHRFWEQDDEKARAQQTIHFLKNVSMLGGLVMVATNGG